MRADRDEYRRVELAGTFLNDRETLVRATTALGMGWWVLTPLRRDDGSVVLVNRGFVPPEQRDRGARGEVDPTAPARVTGLVRMSEPASLLRSNDPSANRWATRDVAAIAAARGLANVAPYFVDAEPAASAAPAPGPVAGLTVVTFPNNHLVYALTWYAMAALLAGASAMAVRSRG